MCAVHRTWIAKIHINCVALMTVLIVSRAQVRRHTHSIPNVVVCWCAHTHMRIITSCMVFVNVSKSQYQARQYGKRTLSTCRYYYIAAYTSADCMKLSRLCGVHERVGQIDGAMRAKCRHIHSGVIGLNRSRSGRTTKLHCIAHSVQVLCHCVFANIVRTLYIVYALYSMREHAH